MQSSFAVPTLTCARSVASEAESRIPKSYVIEQLKSCCAQEARQLPHWNNLFTNVNDSRRQGRLAKGKRLRSRLLCFLTTLTGRCYGAGATRGRDAGDLHYVTTPRLQSTTFGQHAIMSKAQANIFFKVQEPLDNGNEQAIKAHLVRHALSVPLASVKCGLEPLIDLLNLET